MSWRDRKASTPTPLSTLHGVVFDILVGSGQAPAVGARKATVRSLAPRFVGSRRAKLAVGGLGGGALSAGGLAESPPHPALRADLSPHPPSPEGGLRRTRAGRGAGTVIPGWCVAPDPESRDSGF